MSACRVNKAVGHTLLALCALVAVPGMFALDAAAVRAARAESLLQAALRSFDAGNWIQAADWFEEFKASQPDSQKRPFAVLHQSQALFRLERYRDCFTLLNHEKADAGAYADEFAFWMAESRAREGNTVVAAELFRDLPRLHPNSARAVDALLSSATAAASQEDWQQVLDILRPADGVFQKFARANGSDRRAVEGTLLIAEAFHRQGQHEAAGGLLASLRAQGPEKDQDWRRDHLAARLLQVQGRPADALALLDRATPPDASSHGPARRAQWLHLRADLLGQLHRAGDAADEYAKLTIATMPAPYQRIGVLSIMQQRALDEAVGTALVAEGAAGSLTPEDIAVLRLTEGEMRLRQLKDPVAAGLSAAVRSNLVFQAQTNFSAALTGPFAGQAHAALGWADWIQGEMAPSAGNFFKAAGMVEGPIHQALARIKVAESHFRSGDFTNALAHSQSVLLPVSQSQGAPAPLLDHARFLAVRSAAALESIHRTGVYLPYAMQLAAQFSGAAGPPARLQSLVLVAQQQPPEVARKILESAPVLPGATFAGLLDLERARTYLVERNWKAATRQYQDWLASHPQSAPELRGAVELDLAWILQMDNERDRALQVFTNVIARYPDSSASARAQMGLADHFFHLGGTNHVLAEARYQLVRGTSNCPPDLGRRAVMMAGRSALARQNYPNARAYFESLMGDEKCPASVRAEAAFALGDSAILDPTKPVAKHDEAIGHFAKLITLLGSPTNAMAIQAQGRIGDCQLQLASEDPRRFAAAQKAYEAVLQLTESLPGNSELRASAMLGLAQVHEKQTEPSLDKAIGLYLRVFEGAGAATAQHDAFWIQQAGLGAARLLQQAGRLREAVDILRRLGGQFPGMRPALAPRLEPLEKLLKAPGSR